MDAIPQSMWIGVALTVVVMATLGAFVSRPEWPRYQQAFVCAVSLLLASVAVAGYNDFGFLLHATDEREPGPADKGVSGVNGWNNSVTRGGWSAMSAQQRWAVRRAAGITTFAIGTAACVGGAAYSTHRRRAARGW